MKFSAILAILVFSATGAAAQTQEPDLILLDSALNQVGMTRADVRFDRDELAVYQGHPWRLPYFELFHNSPFKLPQHSALTMETIGADAGNITKLTAQASRLAGHPIRRDLIGDPLEPYLVYPDTITVPSITRSKNALPGEAFNRLKDGIDLIYRMADDDKFLFRRGLQEVNKDKYRDRLFEFFINGKEEFLDEVYEIEARVDFDYLLAGAQDFVEAARRLAQAGDSLVFPEGKREIKTGKGLIVVGSPGDDTYEYFFPPLMIIDGSGNDTYRYSGYPDGYPLSIVIDLAGNDRYISTDSTKPGIGGAVLGASIVIDRSGNDYYEGINVTQGGSLFGLGLVWDLAGDDIDVASDFAQAAATFGLGLLVDASGADSLHCLEQSQGFGYTGGCGLLVNLKGDDKYVADDQNIVNPSPQTKEHNASLAQGVGFGRRADYLDGHSWAGGVGMLCDFEGNDTYSAGLFAQGCAYWHAVGMLLDGGGNDTYKGVWYVQGSGAHYSVGYLDDFDGDDSYTASHNMAIEAGHDFTIGFLCDRGGNDTYEAPNLSLGGGNAAGIGIFFDLGGDDTYRTGSGTTLGRANSSGQGVRKFLHCFGIFVDGGGTDVYNEGWAGNGSRWIGPQQDTTMTDPYSIGVGIDAE